MDKRRPSLAFSSPIVTGRRLSTDITPVITTPVADDSQSRRGSLRDLGIEREAFLKLQLEPFPSRGIKGAIRTFLSNIKVDMFTNSDGPAESTTPTAAHTLDSLTDPVEAFDALITAGVECLPVSTASLHQHTADGKVVYLPGHPMYVSTGLPRTFSSMTPRSFAPSEPTTPKSGANKLETGSLVKTQSSSSISQPSPTLSTRSSFQQQQQELLQSPSEKDRNSQTIPCPATCPHRNLVGWIDIRDLISCIIYVYKQPADEDSVVNDLTQTATPVTSPFYGEFPPMPSSLVFTNRGLDGIVDIPIPSDPVVVEYDDSSPGTRSPVNGALKASRSGSLSHHRASLSLMPALDEDSELPPSTDDNLELTPLSHSSSSLSSTITTTTSPSSPSIASHSPSSRSTTITTPTASHTRNQDRSPSPAGVNEKIKINLSDLPRRLADSWDSTLKYGLRHFSPSSAITTSYLARRNQMKAVVASSSTMVELLQLFALGAHCVPILQKDTTNEILYVVTQYDIISFLYSHMDDLKEFFDSNVDELNLGSSNIVQVRDSIIGLDALQEMDENRKTCLAVVDDDGLLIGATSVNTILRITKDRSHQMMSEPLMAFIKGHDHELCPEKIEDTDRVMASHGTVAILDENVTIREVLRCMKVHHITRVFLVDENSFPMTIISLTDVLRCMFDMKH